MSQGFLTAAAGSHARKPGRGFHRQSLGRQLRLVGEWTVEHMGKEDLQGALWDKPEISLSTPSGWRIVSGMKPPEWRLPWLIAIIATITGFWPNSGFYSSVFWGFEATRSGRLPACGKSRPKTHWGHPLKWECHHQQRGQKESSIPKLGFNHQILGGIYWGPLSKAK